MTTEAERLADALQRAKSLVAYDPETGLFTRVSSRNQHAPGAACGWKTDRGYISIKVAGKTYFAHRLAFVFMTGSLPSGDVDHINGVKDDNRWTNLRDVSRRVNSQNIRRPRANSASQLVGAHWFAKKRLWTSSVSDSGKTTHLGYFRTPEEAHAAYVQAKRQMHEGNTL